MLGIVLPTTAILCIDPVPALNVGSVPALEVPIAHEVVVVIDVDVVIAAPPTATPTPSTYPCSAHCDSYTKGDRHSRCVVTGRRITNWWIWICRRTINHGRVVAGNVNYFGVRLLNHNHLFVFDGLGFYLLFFSGL